MSNRKASCLLFQSMLFYSNSCKVDLFELYYAFKSNIMLKIKSQTNIFVVRIINIAIAN